MSLIPQVGRKHWSIRIQIVLIYFVLTVGSVTMIYPFAIMISTSFKTELDVNDYDLYPRYFKDADTLYRKWLQSKYNEKVREYNIQAHATHFDFAKVKIPAGAPEALIADWRELLSTGRALKAWRQVGEIQAVGNKSIPKNMNRFHRRLEALGDLETLRKKYDIRMDNLRLLRLSSDEIASRRYFRSDSALSKEYYNWCDALEPWETCYISIDGAFKDFLANRHGRTIEKYNNARGTEFASWDELHLKRTVPDGAAALTADWDAFTKKQRGAFARFLENRYQGRIKRLNAKYGKEKGQEFSAFSDVRFGYVRTHPGGGGDSSCNMHADWVAFVKKRSRDAGVEPAEGTAAARAVYADFLAKRYESEIERLNKKYGASYQSFSEVPYGNLRADWVEFAQQRLHIQYLQISPRARPSFAAFLAKLYGGKIDLLNERYGSSYGAFSEVPFPAERLYMTRQRADFEQYSEKMKSEYITLTGPDFVFRDFLRVKYSGNLAALNEKYGKSCASFEEIRLPYPEIDYADFLLHKREIFWEFVKRNYRQVFDYLVLHGRSLWNTFVYCGMAICFALTVNPLAAYAMSRYSLPTTYKILLFCMATMAFPPMVTMIPNFLLIKELHLLNTYWALVLPSMANGYSIFLLKGFFDSLPRELYEAAEIDGAGEWTIFWRVTMTLSKPILAVIGLAAFTAAYGNFMMAFIVCQDSRMWTLMPWLYQLQLQSTRGVTFAGLILAAIPTFTIFLFCQKLIMRGIVVPTEK